jgi:hypothetical protein
LLPFPSPFPVFAPCLLVRFAGAINETNIELGVIDEKTKKFRILPPAQVKEYLAVMD